MRKKTFRSISAVFISVAVLLAGLYGVVFLRYPNKFLQQINAASSEFDVESELIQAVIWTESKYAPDAFSNAGAMGLMQLMPSTAAWCLEKLGEPKIDDAKLLDPSVNIRLGTYYLSFLLKRFDEKDAIAAYNAGQGNVRKWLDEGLKEYPYKETRDYVSRVIFARKIYKKLV